MNPTETIQKIIQSIKTAQSQDIQSISIWSDKDYTPLKHEFLFFIKPEITLNNDSINLVELLNMFFNKLFQYKLIVKDIRILGSNYLEKYNIIAQHYGVINALSRRPLEILSAEARAKFESIYGISVQKAPILGSLQFLEKYSGYNADTLDELWQKNEMVKLAGGTYCARIFIEGQTIYLINGFHPKQLIHFTEKGRSIVTFTLSGNMDWSMARNNFIGKTNPADALPGSLRNELLINKKKYGLESVSASRNGFHLSAGPVEGLVELIRYSSDFASADIRDISDFGFGRELQNNFSDSQIRKIMANASVTCQGKNTNIFDLTEEKNGDASILLIKACDLN